MRLFSFSLSSLCHRACVLQFKNACDFRLHWCAWVYVSYIVVWMVKKKSGEKKIVNVSKSTSKQTTVYTITESISQYRTVQFGVIRVCVHFFLLSLSLFLFKNSLLHAFRVFRAFFIHTRKIRKNWLLLVSFSFSFLYGIEHFHKCGFTLALPLEQTLCLEPLAHEHFVAYRRMFICIKQNNNKKSRTKKRIGEKMVIPFCVMFLYPVKMGKNRAIYLWCVRCGILASAGWLAAWLIGRPL